MSPTVDTPKSLKPKNQDAAIPPPTAANGAGECGHRRSIPARAISAISATASVSSEVSGMCWMMLSASWKNPCLVIWMPSSLGIWSRTMTQPIPALKPVRTGVEMKLATKPRRSSEAATRIRPVSAERVAAAVISRAGSPSGTARPSWVPAKMASVVVELKLRTREVPSSA